jgi:hypothetical protein
MSRLPDLRPIRQLPTLPSPATSRCLVVPVDPKLLPVSRSSSLSGNLPPRRLGPRGDGRADEGDGSSSSSAIFEYRYQSWTSSVETVRGWRWRRRYSLMNVLVRIRKSQALRFEPSRN